MAKRKKRTRKNKPIQEGSNINVNIPNDFSVSPSVAFIDDPEIQEKVIVYCQEDALSDDFVPPKKYYFVTPSGYHVFFKTTKRLTAQKMIDKMYGEGMFTVRTVVHAITR